MLVCQKYYSLGRSVRSIFSPGSPDTGINKRGWATSCVMQQVNSLCLLLLALRLTSPYLEDVIRVIHEAHSNNFNIDSISIFFSFQKFLTQYVFLLYFLNFNLTDLFLNIYIYVYWYYYQTFTLTLNTVAMTATRQTVNI